MSSGYYIQQGDKVQGPFSPQQIRNGNRVRKITGDELASEGSGGPWVPLRMLIPDLFTASRDAVSSAAQDGRAPTPSPMSGPVRPPPRRMREAEIMTPQSMPTVGMGQPLGFRPGLIGIVLVCAALFTVAAYVIDNHNRQRQNAINEVEREAQEAIRRAQESLRRRGY